MITLNLTKEEDRLLKYLSTVLEVEENVCMELALRSFARRTLEKRAEDSKQLDGMINDADGDFYVPSIKSFEDTDGVYF